MNSVGFIGKHLAWLLIELVLGIMLCLIPIAWSGALNERTLTAGLIIASILLIPSELLRQFVGPTAFKHLWMATSGDWGVVVSQVFEIQRRLGRTGGDTDRLRREFTVALGAQRDETRRLSEQIAEVGERILEVAERVAIKAASESDSRPRLIGLGTPLSSIGGIEILDETSFKRIMEWEQKRSERTGVHLALMRLEPDPQMEHGEREGLFGKVLQALVESTRETDVAGWYREGLVLGVIFTEINAKDTDNVAAVLRAKVKDQLHGVLDADQAEKIQISWNIFPGDWTKRWSGDEEPGLMRGFESEVESRANASPGRTRGGKTF